MSDPALPEMTAHKLLPPGIHDCTLEAVEDRFGRFQKTGRRPHLFKKLQEYVAEIQRANWSATIIVNGSFVMGAVEEPGDIDLILVLPPDWDMAADVKPFEYNLLSKKRVRRLYGFDVFAVRHGSTEEGEWISFFKRISPQWNSSLSLPVGLEKGLLRIVP